MAQNEGGNRIINMAKSVYNDPFMWNLVKSWAFFAGGVFIAREVFEFDPSFAVAPPMGPP
ncbi:uncharacterized protein LOC124494409 [Dermatophagoides farinae]|uniref:Uncharacterized protein n=1 Tax=Dermatophagoides farinae TaxID=6954 RepID=A0A922HY37_DERFA|nr:hypothetical protein HUG17_7402 [Dermatophagoides farinae]KAH9511017.1 hypothetical protein DERF_009502 [Dermatophagoides farinae]